MAACIQLDHVTKRYHSVVAVDDLSLEVQRGEVFGLLGPNGAGKSTTLYMLCGLAPPTGGALTIFGRDLATHFLDIIPRMGVLVERPAFYDNLSARRNLLILAELAGREVTVDRALDRMGLLKVASRPVGTFSQGMRQRLGLAQALLTEPELLILDEPTSGLDAESTVEVLELLRHLADEAGVTVVFSSHMLHEVELLCDRVAILNQGRLVACEETQALVSYDQTHVDVLVESPEAVGHLLDDEAWVKSVEVRPGRVVVDLGEEATINQLVKFLMAGGHALAGVIPRRRTLRDYFLERVKTP